MIILMSSVNFSVFIHLLNIIEKLHGRLLSSNTSCNYNKIETSKLIFYIQPCNYNKYVCLDIEQLDFY